MCAHNYFFCYRTFIGVDMGFCCVMMCFMDMGRDRMIFAWLAGPVSSLIGKSGITVSGAVRRPGRYFFGIFILSRACLGIGFDNLIAM